MLRFDIITIFPEFFRETIDCGIVRRARNAGLVQITAHDLRQWTTDKHHIVDDRPFGGGDGMVLKPEPIFAAVEALTGASRRAELPPSTRVVLLSAQGEVFSQRVVQEFAQEFSTSDSRIVLLCGRYEGVDERVSEALVTDEISIGDYVLSGGEPAAMVVIDAVVRLLPLSTVHTAARVSRDESPGSAIEREPCGDCALAKTGRAREDAAEAPGFIE
jgi:tRNA (guanine37-N1)-methyltransferase